MKKAAYTLLFWPAFLLGWVGMCFKLGYEAGQESFYQWCKESGSN